EGKRIDELNMRELYELRSNFGFLFQSSALFDSMTVEENILLPLIESRKSYTNEELNKKVDEKLELVGMSGVQMLKPAELSGGMKKRVGLARALITDPDYIFYDEPTTGLDPIMSDSIDELIKELTDKLNVTSIVVTHDMYSVKNVAHQVAMMHEGKIYFVGDPNDLLNSEDFTIREFIQRTE
ncbi:MAG: ATP-binding cassette domain-containing protein, partial [Ignavibacterium sp.]